MAQLGGRRPHLGSDRWIDYIVFYTASDDGQRVLYESVLSDEVGICPEAPSGTVAFVPGAAFGVDETHPRRMRLSYATVGPEDLDRAVELLVGVITRP